MRLTTNPFALRFPGPRNMRPSFRHSYFTLPVRNSKMRQRTFTSSVNKFLHFELHRSGEGALRRLAFPLHLEPSIQQRRVFSSFHLNLCLRILRFLPSFSTKINPLSRVCKVPNICRRTTLLRSLWVLKILKVQAQLTKGCHHQLLISLYQALIRSIWIITDLMASFPPRLISSQAMK